MKAKIENKLQKLEKDYQTIVDKRNDLQIKANNINQAIVFCNKEIIGYEKSIFDFKELLKEDEEESKK